MKVGTATEVGDCSTGCCWNLLGRKLERGEKSIGQYYAASQAPTFAGRVKDAAIAFFPESPKFEVVESKDMVPVSEGGKFEFGVEDIGVIYIETDTKQSYTFDRGGNKITVING